MKKNYFLYVVALLLTYACSSSQPEDCFIPKNAVEFAGNAFSSFSLGADVKLYTVQNPENSSQWTIQAVVPVRKVVSTPIDELSIDLVMLDDRGLRVRDGLVLQAEDMPNLLPVFNAGENMERAIVFSIPDEAKKYLSASDVSQLLNETKGVGMNFNVLTPPERSPATEVETSVAPEPSPAKVAATPAAPEKKAVEAPKNAMSHIQNTAPGPPRAMAVATPTILPVPTRPDSATQNASKEDMPCLVPSSETSFGAKRLRIISPNRLTCTKRVRMEK